MTASEAPDDDGEATINVCSAGGCIVMLTIEDGYGSSAQVYLSKQEARELAASIEHHSDLAARGVNSGIDIACSCSIQVGTP